MGQVKFNYADKKLSLPNKTSIKTFIPSIFSQENISLKTINYIFCSDDYLVEINKTHLQHDYYTDIITFSLNDSGTPVIGEIYISIDRVKENSIQLKTPLLNEILRVLFHGCLHLCGYKDKTKKEEELMRQKEDFYINQFLSL